MVRSQWAAGTGICITGPLSAKVDVEDYLMVDEFRVDVAGVGTLVIGCRYSKGTGIRHAARDTGGNGVAREKPHPNPGRCPFHCGDLPPVSPCRRKQDETQLTPPPMVLKPAP